MGPVSEVLIYLHHPRAIHTAYHGCRKLEVASNQEPPNASQTSEALYQGETTVGEVSIYPSTHRQSTLPHVLQRV